MAIGGAGAFVATQGSPFDTHRRTETVNQDASVTPETAPAGTPSITGVAGAPVPSGEPVSSGEAASSAEPSAGISAETTEIPVPIGRANPSQADLALHKNVESSSDESPGYPATGAVDGNIDTRWSSGFADPQWIRVDLAGIWSISDVRLTWEHAYAIKYRVDVSVDDKRWTTVYQTTSGTEGIRDIPIGATPARYIRVYGTQRSGPYGYSLLDFQVR